MYYCRHMPNNPENYANNDVELAMLRSDIAELFQANTHIVAFLQAEDLEQPVEIVLAGGCAPANNKLAAEIDIQVRQRLDSNGTDYLIILGTPGDYSWCQINDRYASLIHSDGERPLTPGEIATLRQFVNSDITQWSEAQARQCAKMKNLYEKADTYAKRI